MAESNEKSQFKKVSLTFYDSLETIPFTTSFYVRANATSGQIQELVRCISSLSTCALGKYKIELVHTSDDVPDKKVVSEIFEISGYKQKVSTSTAIAGRKWLISYKDSNNATKSHTIPGRDPETSYLNTRNMRGKFGSNPDLDHPKWKAFMKIFYEICLSNKGREIRGQISVKASDEKWPPKSARR